MALSVCINCKYKLQNKQVFISFDDLSNYDHKLEVMSLLPSIRHPINQCGHFFAVFRYLF